MCLKRTKFHIQSTLWLLKKQQYFSTSIVPLVPRFFITFFITWYAPDLSFHNLTVLSILNPRYLPHAWRHPTAQVLLTKPLLTKPTNKITTSLCHGSTLAHKPRRCVARCVAPWWNVLMTPISCKGTTVKACFLSGPNKYHSAPFQLSQTRKPFLRLPFTTAIDEINNK